MAGTVESSERGLMLEEELQHLTDGEGNGGRG